MKMTTHTDLIQRLRDEPDLCANEGAADIAALLDEAAKALEPVQWQPIQTAPRDGTSFLVPPDGGYTQCFWQEPFWWWHNGSDEGYAAGPEPKGWAPLMSQSATQSNTSAGHVVATYTRTPNGTFFNATAAGLALPPGKYQLCVAKGK